MGSTETIEERAGATDPESDAEAAEAMGAKPDGGTPEPAPDLEGEGDGEQPEGGKLFDLTLEGDRKLDSKVGGQKPDKATVKLRGGSILVPEGQYEKGTTIHLAVKVRCTEVHFVDKMDNSTGEVVEVERRQIMKITGVEKV